MASFDGVTFEDEHAGCRVTIRFADIGGRLRPVDVGVASDGGVPAEALRTLPLRSWEATVNGPMGQFLAGVAGTLRPPRPVLKFRVPGGPGRKPDEFYQRVAAAYSWLAAGGRGPATELAELNQVPVSTVHRWVKEARARGLLAPGQKGRAI